MRNVASDCHGSSAFNRSCSVWAADSQYSSDHSASWKSEGTRWVPHPASKEYRPVEESFECNEHGLVPSRTRQSLDPG